MPSFTSPIVCGRTSARRTSRAQSPTTRDDTAVSARFRRTIDRPWCVLVDVTIIGAGLAGLQLARLLARGGASVLLVDARRSVTQSVRTTGIFVRRTIEDFPSLHPFLGAPVRAIGIHSPAGRSIELTGPGDEFRVGRMKPLYAAMLRQAIAAGVQWLPETAYAGVDRREDHCEVRFRDGSRVTTRFLAGADGARSR